MFSPILLMFILAQAVALATVGSDQPQPVSISLMLNRDAVFISSTVLVGLLCVFLSSEFVSRLAFPGIRAISSIRIFLGVQWIVYLLGSRFNLWIEQFINSHQGMDLYSLLVAVLSLATSHVVMLLAILTSLVVGLELMIRWLMLGEKPQILTVFRPVVVLFGIGAMSKVVGEFGLMIAQ